MHIYILILKTSIHFSTAYAKQHFSFNIILNLITTNENMGGHSSHNIIIGDLKRKRFDYSDNLYTT
jgi:hypothetical protein